METPDEFFVGSNDQIHMASVKGRRTKRQRVVTTSSTTCGGGGGTAVSTTSSSGAGGGVGDEDFASSSSHTLVSHEEIIIDQHQEMSTEEEEDMANCLIMLAQGDGPDQSSQISVSVSASATTQSKATASAVGFYVYECKTCNRTFPSFQALGGHRASHKKPKPTTIPAVVSMATAAADETIKKLPIPIPITRDESKELQFSKIVPVQITNKPNKIHECSICGLEFTSGQALGGHMRRHRAAAAAVVSSTQVSVSAAMNMQDPTGSGTMETEMKRRNILQLDLNLPAPEEDLRETKFQFTATPQTIVFSSPTLVDCHY